MIEQKLGVARLFSLWWWEAEHLSMQSNIQWDEKLIHRVTNRKSIQFLLKSGADRVHKNHKVACQRCVVWGRLAQQLREGE